MTFAIVTTTINTRPPSYEAWSKQGTLIVAGDLNTPVETHNFVAELGGRFLVPENYFPGMDYVPMRCIMRRNAAIWSALIHEFDYIFTVDDDNHPNSDRFLESLSTEIGHQAQHTVGSRSGFLNLGEICIPWFHQRGTPYGVDTRMNALQHLHRPAEVVVAQAMVLGDPDCDAVERIANGPMVQALGNRIVVTPGVYAAFNSQATLWRRDWAPVMAVLPHVGRYDDIFASMIFHRMARTYNVALYAGDPVVTQERNWHNNINDLRAELYGMNRIFAFCSSLDAAIISADMPKWMAYSELIEAVSHLLPEPTVKFAMEWVRGWKDLP